MKARGTLRAVDLFLPSVSVLMNYAEGLVMLDKDNNWVPCLAQDLRWVDERTIEFKLRRGVTFHNGEELNAEAVRVNWEEYRKMMTPRPFSFSVLRDETVFEVIDKIAMELHVVEGRSKTDIIQKLQFLGYQVNCKKTVGGEEILYAKRIYHSSSL